MYELQDKDKKKILPPLLKRPPGRPKKSRNLSYGEWRKKNLSFCTRCKMIVKHDSLICVLILDYQSPKTEGIQLHVFFFFFEH